MRGWEREQTKNEKCTGMSKIGNLNSDEISTPDKRNH